MPNAHQSLSKDYSQAKKNGFLVLISRLYFPLQLALFDEHDHYH
jgi:hypothetical protein